MSNEGATPTRQSSVLLEIDPITKQPLFFRKTPITFKEYFDALENELDDLLGQCKFHIN